MLVINYNIGKNSRTIIADEVISPDFPMAFVSTLSEQEKENPLAFIHEFFYSLYPIPLSRSLLNEICLKAGIGMEPMDIKSLSDIYSFTCHFKKLLETAYMISKKDLPQTRVKANSKCNLIPKHILEKGRKIEVIQSYFPSSSDPVDSHDPIKNLRFVFSEKSLEELFQAFDFTYQNAIYSSNGGSGANQEQFLNHMIFNLLLDSCHLIYVRTTNEQ